METETLLAISAGVTFLLAIAAFWAIWQNKRLQIRSRKERLLKEIIDWVIDIQESSLEALPVTVKFSEDIRKQMEMNTLLKYAKAFGKNEYIRSITRNTFKKELMEDIEKIIDSLIGVLFLKGKSLHIENPKEPFGGTALKKMEEIEKRINEDKETTIEKLLDAYLWALAESRTILLVKIGKLMASL